jgi:dTDP-4-amino-4,6-dideoxygalactose transaminase
MFTFTASHSRRGQYRLISRRSAVASKSEPDITAGKVRAYEEEITRLLGMPYSIAFAYARHALASILTAMDLRPGDEVVLSPLTCKVVPLALLSLDLKPLYADISVKTLNLDPLCVQHAIGRETRAVLFQHTYGNSAGVEVVAEVAERNKIILIEDCAQCLPYASDERSPGSWGQGAIFSNNLLKPLPAGSGGVAVTKNSKLARKIRELRNHLSTRGKLGEIMLHAEVWLHRFVLRPALYWPLFRLNAKLDPNYKTRSVDVEIAREITKRAHQVSDYQVREGIRWLHQVEAIAAHRRRCCDEYATLLSDADHLDLPAAGTVQPLYYFPVLVRNKQRLLNEAQRKRIEIISWPTKTPIYPVEREQDLYRYGYQLGACPIAEMVAATLIGLPTHLKITATHQKRIIAFILSKRVSCVAPRSCCPNPSCRNFRTETPGGGPISWQSIPTLTCITPLSGAMWLERLLATSLFTCVVSGLAKS